VLARSTRCIYVFFAGTAGEARRLHVFPPPEDFSASFIDFLVLSYGLRSWSLVCAPSPPPAAFPEPGVSAGLQSPDFGFGHRSVLLSSARAQETQACFRARVVIPAEFIVSSGARNFSWPRFLFPR
jgi:hypothetical protein